METSRKGSLPRYQAEAIEIDGEPMLEVTCPRRDCKQQFIVARRWRTGGRKINGRKYDTRPCPWCFRVAKLPRRS